MFFKQFYLNCLAQASYFIGNEGVAAVIDPQRDVDQYLALAEENGLTIKYVIETHVHADFVSGHRELAKKTGATICIGQAARPGFPARLVKDEEEISLGQVVLRFLETPGHTPESLSILVIDKKQSPIPQMILTGDTLFLGDVGRPDLIASRGKTPEQMASLLYESLTKKILPLPDSVVVYPGHGAGSLCGRYLSNAQSSTLGEQRQNNRSLKAKNKTEFLSLVLEGLPPVPDYFLKDAEANLAGPALLESLPRPKALSPQEFSKLVATEPGPIALDVRSALSFAAGHVPKSLNIGLSGNFAPWAGAAVPGRRKVVLVTDTPEQMEEAIIRLARVGIDEVVGYLEGGFAAWESAGLPVGSCRQIDVTQIARGRSGALLIDVRRPSEFASGHAPEAQNLPLDELFKRYHELPMGQPVRIICQSGYRSSLACSFLKSRGYTQVENVVGGTNAWKAASLPLQTEAL